MTKSTFDLNFDFSIIDGYEDDNEALKFDLYLMTREIQQISQQLKSIQLLPKQQKKYWLSQHQRQLKQLMDKLMDEVMGTFDKISLDLDAMPDSIACVTQLRELINLLNNLMGDGKLLRG